MKIPIEIKEAGNVTTRNVIFQHPVALCRSDERLRWPTNTQQNSRPSENIQGSHNQQTKQNQTQGHPNKTDGNSHNQNNQRQLQ
jgi:hypothetical protein